MLLSDLLDVLFGVIFPLAVADGELTCYIGQELNPTEASPGSQWVLPYQDPCHCARIAPGGFNALGSRPALRGFTVAQHSLRPIFVRGADGVREETGLECQDAVPPDSKTTLQPLPVDATMIAGTQLTPVNDVSPDIETTSSLESGSIPNTPVNDISQDVETTSSLDFGPMPGTKTTPHNGPTPDIDITPDIVTTPTTQGSQNIEMTLATETTSSLDFQSNPVTKTTPHNYNGEGPGIDTTQDIVMTLTVEGRPNDETILITETTSDTETTDETPTILGGETIAVTETTGATGEEVILDPDASCDTWTTYSTSNNYVYHFPFAPFDPTKQLYVKFAVRTGFSGMLALTATNNNPPRHFEDLYEIAIDYQYTQTSRIRRCKDCSDRVVVSNADDLNENVFKYFWLRYKSGYVEVGVRGMTESFLAWQDPSPLDVHYLGLASDGWPSDWKFCFPTEGTVFAP